MFALQVMRALAERLSLQLNPQNLLTPRV